jgi:hypothetical protein
LEHLAVNAKVATVLGLIPASSDTKESEGAADEAVLNNIHYKKNSIYPVQQRIFRKYDKLLCMKKPFTVCVDWGEGVLIPKHKKSIRILCWM